MKDFLLQMYERQPTFTTLAGIIVAAIMTAIVGHIIYLFGLAISAVAIVVGITFVVGVKYGDKSRNDKNGNSGSGHRP